MTDMRITTNRHWHTFKCDMDVPAKVLADDFDYQDREDVVDGFLKYRGHWYHLDQFMRIAEPVASNVQFQAWKGWHAYAGDSYFSGVLLRISDDGERYQVATYTC